MPGIDQSEADFIAVIELHAQEHAAKESARIPAAFEGIQVNFCKTPDCVNFGVPEDDDGVKWSRDPAKTRRYAKVSAGKDYPHLRCNACKASFPLKSNEGIAQEVARLAGEAKADICCPDESCSNHGFPVGLGKPLYSSFGKTAIGSPRWKCMACSKTFSAPKTATHRQRQSHKNKLIFTLLVNQMAMRRICEVAEIGPKALYDKIDFIHRQCQAFAASREAMLPNLPIRRLYLGVDRQDYAVNWTQRDDRRNVVLSSATTVDNETGYCFGMHVNFDPSLDPTAVEQDAHDSLDYRLSPPFRKHAREWMESDYRASVARSAKLVPGGTVAC